MSDELSGMVLGLTIVAGITIVGLLGAEIYRIKTSRLKKSIIPRKEQLI